MNDLPSAVVRDLIALGCLDDGPSAKRDQLLARLKPFESVKFLGSNCWNEVADTLSEVELRNLVRGLTVAEVELGWYGGSVSSIIYVYQRYAARFSADADALADWVLARSENDYVPFGRMRAGARSVAEFKSYLSAKARRHDESEQEQEGARQHKRIRAAVRRRLARERQMLQDAHSKSRAELITQLEELSATERLEHVAWDDFHSLAFFPSSFAKVDRQALGQLDGGTRKRLLDKAASRRKGAWKRLHDKSCAEGNDVPVPRDIVHGRNDKRQSRPMASEELGDQPKSLASLEARLARQAELADLHIAPLTAFVDMLRAEMGSRYQIPYFDPLDGGTAAEALFLLEAPGARAVVSGFISRNNPDETAKNFFLLNRESGISRKRTITWNIVPWYIGTGSRIRPATSDDIEHGIRPLNSLLKLLPELRAIVLVGQKAQRGSTQIANLRPDLRVFKAPHPSPLFVNQSPLNRKKILIVLNALAEFLGPSASDNQSNSH